MWWLVLVGCAYLYFNRKSCPGYQYIQVSHPKLNTPPKVHKICIDRVNEYLRAVEQVGFVTKIVPPPSVLPMPAKGNFIN